ncbi:hypothetical protein [Streptomyces sp. NPDC000229]|uniref:hypothetical protein n=1 Tax=Streptomyces sp. NPDC000229 TaxID=3154247 RepID=UPI00331A77C0
MARTLQRNADRLEFTARTVSWTVAAYAARGRKVHASPPLEVAETVRDWHSFWGRKDFVQRVDIAELATDIAERLITLDDLPAAGQPAELPELPASAHQARRHYRFTRGPMVLPTPDHVRRYYAWLTNVQTNPLPNYPRVDLDKLKLLEVTLIHYARPILLGDLPS